MRWSNVQANWSAFYEAITEKWPEADQRAFIRYIAEVTGQEIAETKDEIREWLAGEIPSDVVMDPIHDGQSLALSAKFVGEGEDEYDDDARFGDDDEIRGDGDLNDPR